MKNKKLFIEDFLSRFYRYHPYVESHFIWYYDQGKYIYHEDMTIPYHSSKPKFFCFISKKRFTPKQFVKHIRRMNGLKAFW